LGSRAFVQSQLLRYRQQAGRQHVEGPFPIPTWTDWGDLTTLRKLRRSPVG
jgi:hypothetical protein